MSHHHIDLPKLKVELRTDPNTYGYAVHLNTGALNVVAELLNKQRKGDDGKAAITVRKRDISGSEIYQQVALADYPALPNSPNAGALSNERRFLAYLSGLPAIQNVQLITDEGLDTPVVANFRAFFPDTSPTWLRLVAISSRYGSRAEQLFGPDVNVSEADITEALR